MHRLRSDKELIVRLSITYFYLAKLHSYMHCEDESDDDSSIFSKVKLLSQKRKGFLASRKVGEITLCSLIVRWVIVIPLLPFVQNC